MIIFLFTVVLLVILYMMYKAHHDIVEFRTILDDRLPKPFQQFQIFFISDIHRRKIKNETLDQINQNINVVIIGGDLTEKKVPFSRTRKNVKKLKRWGAPIYFVWGNNDFEVQPDKLSQLLQDEGVTILNNSYVHIQKEGHILSLIGLEYNPYMETTYDINSIESKGDYLVLLTHRPDDFYLLDSMSQNNIHLVLAGHTHGGQIRIGPIGFYEKGSFKEYRSTKILISEGYGYTLLPFRFGTKAECHVLTLDRN
ncbi:metallophosphoesterase [Ornithinibacillus sp. L9]|uniref:Metallophosphoesterase n=1 Tax=Ornithinibacillus caprae TaxID=2678566 RepID=A0A6N8FCZ6_9BACI|nr:metallophosphoesterase [Ornithinibacillus caprae]MUK87245.1 metallophosphoesterase [Ornithinibacillus caprae]